MTSDLYFILAVYSALSLSLSLLTLFCTMRECKVIQAFKDQVSRSEPVYGVPGGQEVEFRPMSDRWRPLSPKK